MSNKFELEERTEQFAMKIVQVCRSLPFNTVNKTLLDQILRSSSSVGANYIEANYSLSKKDFLYRLKICRKEMRETGYWLRLLRSTNQISDEDMGQMIDEQHQIFLIFCRIINKVENKNNL